MGERSRTISSQREYMIIMIIMIIMTIMTTMIIRLLPLFFSAAAAAFKIFIFSPLLRPCSLDSWP